MNTHHASLFEPFFLSGSQGALMACYFAPTDQPIKAQLLVIPPFAEEMNKARMLLSRQARLLAQQGYACLLLDLYGTGDSDGDFDNASWPIWLLDVATGVQFLQQKNPNTPLVLWGVRAGALLAADYWQQHPQHSQHLLTWHPQWDGRHVIHPFLRLRKAAHLKHADESMADIQAQLQQGHIEVAGYPLTATLANQIQAQQVKNYALPTNGLIEWINIAVDTEQSYATQELLALWQGAGMTTHYTFVDVAESFWLVNDPTHQVALYQITLQCLEAHYAC